jgi:hypothetical protein
VAPPLQGRALRQEGGRERSTAGGARRKLHPPSAGGSRRSLHPGPTSSRQTAGGTTVGFIYATTTAACRDSSARS